MLTIPAGEGGARIGNLVMLNEAIAATSSGTVSIAAGDNFDVIAHDGAAVGLTLGACL